MKLVICQDQHIKIHHQALKIETQINIGYFGHVKLHPNLLSEELEQCKGNMMLHSISQHLIDETRIFQGLLEPKIKFLFKPGIEKLKTRIIQTMSLTKKSKLEKRISSQSCHKSQTVEIMLHGWFQTAKRPVVQF